MSCIHSCSLDESVFRLDAVWLWWSTFTRVAVSCCAKGETSPGRLLLRTAVRMDSRWMRALGFPERTQPASEDGWMEDGQACTSWMRGVHLWGNDSQVWTEHFCCFKPDFQSLKNCLTVQLQTIPSKTTAHMKGHHFPGCRPLFFTGVFVPWIQAFDNDSRSGHEENQPQRSKNGFT